jgi:GATA zinc finger
MTYSRPMSDSMIIESTPATNGNHSDAAWAGNSTERTEHQNGDEEAHEPRQLTDSPGSNGASHASAGGNPPVCQNCGTSTTPLWRRNELGATLCNACGLFLKLHGRARPLNLKTDTIKSRNRVKSVTQPKKKVCFLFHDRTDCR